MNRPHYVMDWEQLDEEIDHCSKHYGHNALAPIAKGTLDDWDERPTGFDFIQYHRAETDLLGLWEPPTPRSVRICQKQFMQIEEEVSTSTRFEIIKHNNQEIELTTLLDGYARPLAIAVCISRPNNDRYSVRYYRVDNHRSIHHTQLNAIPHLLALDAH